MVLSVLLYQTQAIVLEAEVECMGRLGGRQAGGKWEGIVVLGH